MESSTTTTNTTTTVSITSDVVTDVNKPEAVESAGLGISSNSPCSVNGQAKQDLPQTISEENVESEDIQTIDAIEGSDVENVDKSDKVM